MIAKLSGVIDEVSDDSVVIDVNGVGYIVFCSSRTLSKLIYGSTIQLNIETHVREDHIHLFGFEDQIERDWFRLLTTVQGVGTRVALAILSILNPEQLAQSISANDKVKFTQVSGVGPKLASRIVGELKDKVKTIILPPNINRAKVESGHEAELAQDAISALVNLGYSASDSFAVISKVSDKFPDLDVAELIKAGLTELGSKGKNDVL